MPCGTHRLATGPGAPAGSLSKVSGAVRSRTPGPETSTRLQGWLPTGSADRSLEPPARIERASVDYKATARPLSYGGGVPER